MTISVAVLDAMVAAGCSAEQIAAVVKADMAGDADRKAHKRENNADRQRRYRERNAALRVTGVTNGDKRDGTLPPSPSPLVPPPQTPPPIIPQSSSTIPETKRASRLSTDWVLPSAWGRWAISQGHSEATIRLEADKFRDFWCSKSGTDATKLDWEATWRNWMRNSRSAPGHGPPAAKPPSITDVLKAQVLEMQANEQRDTEESDRTGQAHGSRQAVLGFAGSPR